MSLRLLSAALAIGIGLAGVVVATSPVGAADPVPPIRVAIAVPVTVPVSAGGLIAASALEQYTSPLGTLTRQLDAVDSHPVALGIDPRIIVSIRILGTEAPASATAWLARLSAIPNETFPLSYADSDITLPLQAGSSEVLGPEGFDFAIDPARFAAPSTDAQPSPAPKPTAPSTSPPTASPLPTAAAPAVPTLPTSADLLAWPFTLTSLAWPREDTVVSADLPAIAAGGYTTTVLSSGNLDRPAGSGAVASAADSRILVSDSAVSAALRTAARSVSVTEWQNGVAELSSAIAAAGKSQSGSSATVFATLDRTGLTSGSRLADTVATMQVDPAVNLVTLTDLLDTAPTPATIAESPQQPDRVALMAQLLSAQAAEAQFATIADDPVAITASRRLELLALQSNGWIDNPTGWPVVVQQNLSQSLDLLASVQLVSTGDLTFLAAAAPLPVDVSNALDQAVTVWVTVRPDTGLLAVTDSRVELTIEPNSQASAKVPAQAVSNGVVGVTVSLSTSTGAPIGTSSRSRINVQAGWETPVVVIIAILVVGVFGAGLVRNILRLRRAAAARPSDTTGAER